MIKEKSLHSFLDELASSASTPGGGSAAGLMGAMAAALSSMVANLTIGKQQYAAVEEDMRRYLKQSEHLRDRLTDAIRIDVEVFDKVMDAYGMAKDSDSQKQARTQAIQAALQEATDAPLACAELCAEVIALCRPLAEKGNANVISDAGVAVLAAHAALRSAALNVYINLGAIKDQAFAKERRARLEALLADSAAAAEAIYETVKQQITQTA